jgi:hypothetical protein
MVQVNVVKYLSLTQSNQYQQPIIALDKERILNFTKEGSLCVDEGARA